MARSFSTAQGLMAEWLRRGLQILAPEFDSRSGLHREFRLDRRGDLHRRGDPADHAGRADARGDDSDRQRDTRIAMDEYENAAKHD